MKFYVLSKTLWFNLLSLTVAVLESTHLLALVPEGWGPPLASAVAVINIVLRLVTRTALTVKS